MSEKKIGLNEALGRRDSELLSSMVDKVIDISEVEFTEFKGKDDVDTEIAFITTMDGKIYRSSGKAILDQLHKINDVLERGSVVTATVQKVKSKGSKFSYIVLSPVDENATNE